MKLRRWFKLLQHHKVAEHLLSEWLDKEKEASELEQQLKNLRLKRKRPFSPLEVGESLMIADEYGIELHIGTCYGDCRAVLPKEKWERPIRPGTDVWDYSVFIERTPEEIEAIQDLSRYPAHAIAKCLLRAIRCGVVDADRGRE